MAARPVQTAVRTGLWRTLRTARAKQYRSLEASEISHPSCGSDITTDITRRLPMLPRMWFFEFGSSVPLPPAIVLGLTVLHLIRPFSTMAGRSSDKAVLSPLAPTNPRYRMFRTKQFESAYECLRDTLGDIYYSSNSAATIFEF